jgi:uncharacterized protein
MMSLNKVLITGANTGLGKHLAQKFSSEGCEIFYHNGRKHFDLTNKREIYDLATQASIAGVNVLINNAAIVCPNLDFQDYSEELIENMLNVNLRAPILLTYCLHAQLDSIININSMVGLEVKKGRTLYSATKWGLRGFSNSLKQQKKINILDVYPTNIRTTPEKENAMEVDVVVAKIYEAFINKSEKLILDGRRK